MRIGIACSLLSLLALLLPAGSGVCLGVPASDGAGTGCAMGTGAHRKAEGTDATPRCAADAPAPAESRAERACCCEAAPPAGGDAAKPVPPVPHGVGALILARALDRNPFPRPARGRPIARHAPPRTTSLLTLRTSLTT